MLALFGMSILPLWGQHDWTWTFGDSVVMHFPNGGAPEVSLTERSAPTFETGTCYSDSLGNLLLYGYEDSIFNGNFETIEDGWIWGISFSATQGMLFLPAPDGNDSIFVFYIHGGNCGGQVPICLSYSIVDLQHGSQDGKLLSKTLVGYPGNYSLTEKLQAVRHANGKDWWIYVHDYRTNDFFRYLLTPSGLSPYSLQSIGSIHENVFNNPYSPIGEMTFSQDGSRLLVVTATGIIDIFDVNRCTGELSNWQQISGPVPRGADNWYGCAFSPDGTKIYADELDLPFNSHLYQWDLNVPNIPASKTLIYADTTNTYWGQMQLGPDGKIYITTISPDTNSVSNFNLSVINDPNASGIACQYSHLSLYLEGLKTSGNLPNLPNYSLGPLLAQTANAGPNRLICPGESIQVGYPDTTGGLVQYIWSGSNLSNPSEAQPTVSPDSSAWYYLQVIDPNFSAACGTTYDSVFVQVADSALLPIAIAGNDTTVCAGDTIALGGSNNGFQYQWTTSGMNWIESPDSAFTQVSGEGTFVLTAINPQGIGACFSNVATVDVQAYQSQMPQNPAGVDQLICEGDTVQLGLVSGIANWDYNWSGLALIDPNVAQPLVIPNSSGTYFLSANDTTFIGSCAQVSDTVFVTVEQPFVHEAPTDQSFCVGECFMLGVDAQSGLTYSWSPSTGLENPSMSWTKAQPTGSTIYTLNVINPAMQSANCREQSFEVNALADACNYQSFISLNGDGIAEVLDFGDHASSVEIEVFDIRGKRIYSNEDYNNDWNASQLAHGIYVYRVTIAGECGSIYTGKLAILK